MKKTSVIKAGLVFMLAATFSACKKDKNDPGTGSNGQTQATFTLNGDGFSNEKITITGPAGTPQTGGTYVSIPKITVVSVDDNKGTGQNAKNVFTAIVDGNKTGSQKFGAKFASGGTEGENQVEVVLTLNHNGKQVLYDSNGDDFDVKPSGNINITQYGSVGNGITGTFSGTLINQLTGAKLTVSNAQFSVTRLKDITKED